MEPVKKLLTLSYFFLYSWRRAYILLLVNFVICSMLDQQQKQTVPFSGGRCMGEFDGRVFVATSRDVYYLLAIPVEKQVRQCLELCLAMWPTNTLVCH